MPWDGNEGKRMAGVPHSEKSAGFHSSGLPIKTIRHIRNIGYAELKVRCCFFRLQRRNLLHRIHVKDWIYLWVCRTSQPCTPMMKSSPFLNLLLILLFDIENLSNDVFLTQQSYLDSPYLFCRSSLLR